MSGLDQNSSSSLEFQFMTMSEDGDHMFVTVGEKAAEEDPLEDPKILAKDPERMAREIMCQGREIEDLRRQIQVLQLNHKVPLHPSQKDVQISAKSKEDEDSWESWEKSGVDIVGDAVADAVMYNQRFDTFVYKKQFKELYGLGYHQVIEWCECDNALDAMTTADRAVASGVDDGGLIATMNAHATLRLRKNIMTDDFKKAFATFIAEVEKSWLQPPTKDPKSTLAVAYDTFWKHFRLQKKLEAEARLDDFDSNQ